MKTNIIFQGTCVHISALFIDEFDGTAREITYKTFLKHVGRDIVREINEWVSVPIHKDWTVSFEKGKFKGKKAVCMHHSLIHHIWTIE